MDGIYCKYSDNKLNPLLGYLENEKISYSNLIDFVKFITNRTKKPFQEALKVISKKVLGREEEYFDDFYFFVTWYILILRKSLPASPLSTRSKVLFQR